MNRLKIALRHGEADPVSERGWRPLKPSYYLSHYDRLMSSFYSGIPPKIRNSDFQLAKYLCLSFQISRGNKYQSSHYNDLQTCYWSVSFSSRVREVGQRTIKLNVKLYFAQICVKLHFPSWKLQYHMTHSVTRSPQKRRFMQAPAFHHLYHRPLTPSIFFFFCSHSSSPLSLCLLPFRVIPLVSSSLLPLFPLFPRFLNPHQDVSCLNRQISWSASFPPVHSSQSLHLSSFPRHFLECTPCVSDYF